MEIVHGIVVFLAIVITISVVVMFLANFQDSGIRCDNLEGGSRTQTVNTYGRATASFQVRDTGETLTLTAKEEHAGFVNWTINFVTRNNTTPSVEAQEIDSHAPAIVFNVYIDDNGADRNDFAEVLRAINFGAMPYTATWSGDDSTNWPSNWNHTEQFVNHVTGTTEVPLPNIGWAKVCDEQKEQAQSGVTLLGIVILIVAVVMLLVVVRMLY